MLNSNFLTFSSILKTRTCPGKCGHMVTFFFFVYLRFLFLAFQDLHRTGCSLFCGAAAEENQALLKRVLLAYARWNKAVGYCQGFNMLAALILQVMDRSETDSVKVRNRIHYVRLVHLYLVQHLHF